MKHAYFRLGVLLALCPLVQLACGQSLTLTGRNPVRNARSALPTTNVALTFSQSLSTNAASLSGLRMFSAQRGGLLRSGQGGSASVSGSTLTFNPTLDFKPGETVFVTSTTAIQSTTGARLSRGQVHQFTTGVGGADGATSPHRPLTRTLGWAVVLLVWRWGMWTGMGIWTCSRLILATPPSVCGSIMGRATSPLRPLTLTLR
ncbi:Ig-like domain-containing protein [Spirosoma sp. BT702]|uniref:Ig-like domain-containing protein n=1 Tax=Spirosoma profusum TaxID=2771354 RepID=A0A927AWI1_9BACT|nr:Ig-like domain-containing protein [Spirosoma profusum]